MAMMVSSDSPLRFNADEIIGTEILEGEIWFSLRCYLMCMIGKSILQLIHAYCIVGATANEIWTLHVSSFAREVGAGLSIVALSHAKQLAGADSWLDTASLHDQEMTGTH